MNKDKLYALPYDAPTMIWQYRKDLFEKYGDRMKQDLGFDPTPSDDSTWEQFYKTSKWFKENAQKDVPYGHGHQAKQHDSLMNDFSNVLWAYGGDYFKDGNNVGRMGSSDPGDPVLDSPRRSRPPTSTASSSRSRIPAAWAGTGTGSAPRSAPARWRWPSTGTSSPPATRPASSRARSATRACRRAPSAAPACTAAPAWASTPPPRERDQKAAWLFVNWATSKKTQLANLESKVGGGTPTRDSVYKLPEVEKAKKPPSKMPNILTTDAVFESWKPENIGLRPKIAAWNECDTSIFTQLSKMLAGQQGPEKCMSNSKDGFMQAIDNAEALRNA